MTRPIFPTLFASTLAACFDPNADEMSDTDASDDQGESLGGDPTSETGGETEAPPDSCGDAIVDPGEQCDAGAANGDGQCTEDCTANVCGDAHPGPSEGCDDGNAIGGDGCSAECLLESCGDGVLDLGEACDDGANGAQDDGCTDLCREPTCGDGFRQPTLGEACDDGNASDTDACLLGCENASCGDGFVWNDVEECDDANDLNGDACLVGCVAATCGDGYLRAGVEDCDAKNVEADDGCSAACEQEEGWACDEGACSEVCGDGLVVGSECCDDGNVADADLCPSSCVIDVRRVFVTSTVQTPVEFGGVAGADSVCQNTAANAGLPGMYRAWISDSSSGPSTRFNVSAACDVPYQRVDGMQIATDWSDLTDGTVAVPINLTEFGDVGESEFVWTGTQTDGTMDELHCEDWVQTGSGRIGYSTFTDFRWTAGTYGGCGGAYGLFCFQQ